MNIYNRIHQNELSQIQALINMYRREGARAEEILYRVEQHLSILVDKVVVEETSSYYTIMTPPERIDGKRYYRVPEHKDIPVEHHGKLVQDRQIAFSNGKENTKISSAD